MLNNPLAVELQRMHDEDRAHEASTAGLTCCSLTQDLDHWAGYGITDVAGLHEYLDACAKENAL